MGGQREAIELNASNLEKLGVRIGLNVFSSDLLGSLVQESAHALTRKITFFLQEKETFPEVIEEAAKLIENRFGVKGINAAVLKRYELDEPSSAFEWHRDPEEYQDVLVLCSLSGKAYLAMQIEENEYEIECNPNTALVVPADIWHRVTPPIPEYGTRHFLFFGKRVR